MPFQAARVGALFLVRFREGLRLEDLAEVRRELSAAYQDARSLLEYVAILPEESQPPPPELRRALARGAAAWQRECAAIHLVIEAGGRQGGLLRAAVADALLLGAKSVSDKVFVYGSLASCLQQIAKRRAVDDDAVHRAARRLSRGEAAALP